ncbi:unnamed protein product [Closterium sp. NIES-54]
MRCRTACSLLPFHCLPLRAMRVTGHLTQLLHEGGMACQSSPLKCSSDPLSAACASSMVSVVNVVNVVPLFYPVLALLLLSLLPYTLLLLQQHCHLLPFPLISLMFLSPSPLLRPLRPLKLHVPPPLPPTSGGGGIQVTVALCIVECVKSHAGGAVAAEMGERAEEGGGAPGEGRGGEGPTRRMGSGDRAAGASGGMWGRVPVPLSSEDVAEAIGTVVVAGGTSALPGIAGSCGILFLSFTSIAPGPVPYPSAHYARTIPWRLSCSSLSCPSARCACRRVALAVPSRRPCRRVAPAVPSPLLSRPVALPRVAPAVPSRPVDPAVPSHRPLLSRRVAPVPFVQPRRAVRPSQVQAHETLWAHASGDLPEPADPAPLAADPTPTDSDRYARERADVTAWKSRDTGACIALSSLLAESEETHFTRVRTASEFMTAIKARYATPTTVSLGRLFLPFLFPDLASFEHTANLITHMRSLDSSYRAACTNAQLAVLPPPMAITIYFIATNLPDHLASIQAGGAVRVRAEAVRVTLNPADTREEQLELEQEERELERQQLELQRLEEQQQQQQPEQEQPQQQPQQQEQQPPPQLEEQRSQPQQEQQQQPPPPPVSGLRKLGLPSPSPPSPPSPSPPSPPSPPISGPPLPPRDPYPAVFPPPLPLLSPPRSHTWPSRRSPRARPSSPVPFTDLHTALFHSSPPRSYPSVLPSPPESALTASLSTPVTDYYRTYHPVLSRALASLVTDPRASLSSVSALTAAVTEFASTRCLEYAISLMAAPPTSPLAVGGESALGCDALEDRQFELEFLASRFPSSLCHAAHP